MWEGRRAALRLPELLPARTASGMGRSSLLSTKCFAVFWFQIPGKRCACRRDTRRAGPPGERGHSQAGGNSLSLLLGLMLTSNGPGTPRTEAVLGFLSASVFLELTECN